MAQRLLVKTNDGQWREPSQSSYKNERELQNLVATTPELLTGQPLATVAEFSLPGTGFVDIVGLGENGSVTVAECKLNGNHEMRRTVVGQLFAYAAAMSHMTWEDFAQQWTLKSGQAPADNVKSRLNVDPDPEEFRSAVENNLRRGSFTLVFVVDDITAELKQVIEYTNSVTRDDVSVLGVELQLAKEGGTQILVPRLWGESVVEAKRARATSGSRWTPESFTAEIDGLEPSERSTVIALMAYGSEHGGRAYWGTGQEPRMSWWFSVGGTDWSLYQVRLPSSGPAVAIHFSGMGRSKSPGPEIAAVLLGELKTNSAFAPFLHEVDVGSFGKVPAIPVRGVLDKPENLGAFTAAMDAARAAAV